MRRMTLIAVALGVLLLEGCESTGPVQPAGPVPAQLSASGDPTVKGKVFTWGGSVIGVRNLKDRTLLEAMAYPLGSDGKPDPHREPLGRFIADHRGFLEPAEYAVGRLVRVTGPMLGYLDGKVGEANYRYPALQATELRLWRGQGTAPGRKRPAVNVGVGIGGGSHGGWGNIGIGVGF